MTKPAPQASTSETGDPLLLTPGPLTTSASVKQAMVHDWGSRDAEFLRINRMVLDKIVELAGGQGTPRHRAGAGLGHLRRRGDDHALRAEEPASCWC